jgi:hypothetical protein
MAGRHFSVQQHCDPIKHRNSLSRHFINQNRQRLLFENIKTPSPSNKTWEFLKDLCEMMVSANIPLHKVNNEQFRNVLEKYTNWYIPTDSTLPKNYLPSCYEYVLRKIRRRGADNKIWVSIDETMDIGSRYVANVVIGTLFADHPGDIYLLYSEVLDRVNHTTVASIFDNTMKLLWEGEVKRDNILLFVTDTAPYMVKAANDLHVLHPRVVHLTCLAQALHRVAEEIRENYPDVDNLISNMKKMFIKAPLRVQKFKQDIPSLSLPSQPVLMLWSTWLEAACVIVKTTVQLRRTLSVILTAMKHLPQKL